MSEPTPPGVPQDPTAATPPSAPPSAPPPAAPPPSAPPPSTPSAPPPHSAPAPPAGGGYSAGPPIGGSVAPAGYANNDEKTWALMAHFGGIVLGFIAPLIVMLVKGNESPTVKTHSVEALNFQITWAAATLVAIILMVCSFGILFFLPMITWLVIIVFSIIAGIKANEGTLYRYPMTFRLIK